MSASDMNLSAFERRYLCIMRGGRGGFTSFRLESCECEPIADAGCASPTSWLGSLTVGTFVGR